MEKDGPLDGRKYNKIKTDKWGKSQQKNIFKKLIFSVSFYYARSF